ncbi:MAG: hypothetical protein ACOCUW_04695, partial [Gemmatimonadota bacterium]
MAAEPRIRCVERDGYAIRLSPAGTGPSVLGGVAVTSGGSYPERHGGIVVYVRDPERRRYWTTALHPGAPRPDRYGAWVDGAAPRFVREDDGIETVMEVVVAAGPAELRRVTIINHGTERRRVELTSYVPLALDDPTAYAAHPAFSKLFLQTEYVPELQGLLARRRPRSPDDPPLSVVHLLVPDEAAMASDAGGAAGSGRPGPESSEPEAPELETDRARFLGRGRGPARPRAMDPDAPPLSGTTGSVLDPALALRRSVVLAPGGA